MESDKVYTCGMCETILEDWVNHPCIEGYERLYMDENHYFYPMTDDGTVIRRSRLADGIEAMVEDELEVPSGKGKENVCPERQSSTTSKSRVPSQALKRALPPNRNGKLTDVEIELLIIEVEKRIPLWNFSIPIEERSRETTSKLWGEVSMAINEKLSADDAKKKFKSLKDVYRRIIHAEQFPSGSGRPASKEKWKFHDQMEFLRDSCLIRPTSSNVSQLNDEEGDRDDLRTVVHLEESADEHRDVESIQSKMRRRSAKDKEADESISVLNRIADAMTREEPVPALPPPPQMDDVDGFLLGVGFNLRRLPLSERMATIIEILNLVHQKCLRFSSET